MRPSALLRPSIVLALTAGMFIACGDKDDDTGDDTTDTDTDTDTDTTDTDTTDTDTDTDTTDTDTDTDTTGPVDEDADGYTADEDCDDADPAINPGADETCDDGIDNDCDDSLDCDDDGCGGDAACAATITGVSPELDAFPQNTPLTITGSGFAWATAGTTTVTAAGSECTDVVVVDDTTITCTLAAGTMPASSPVEVTNGNGTVSWDRDFQRYAPLYMATGREGIAGKLYWADPGSATGGEVGDLPEGFTSLAFAPDGTLYGIESTEYCSNDETGAEDVAGLYTIDPFDGTATLVADIWLSTDGSGPDAKSGEWACSMPDATFVGSTLVAWSESEDGPFTVDLSTGVATYLGGGEGSYGTGLAADADGTVWLLPDGESGTIWTVDTSTGECTSTGVITESSSEAKPIASAFSGTAFYEGTMYSVNFEYGFDGVGQLVSIDTATGAITVISTGLPDGIDSLASMFH